MHALLLDSTLIGGFLHSLRCQNSYLSIGLQEAPTRVKSRSEQLHLTWVLFDREVDRRIHFATRITDFTLICNVAGSNCVNTRSYYQRLARNEDLRVWVTEFVSYFLLLVLFLGCFACLCQAECPQSSQLHCRRTLGSCSRSPFQIVFQASKECLLLSVAW
jgi:hypothetical protein